MFLTPSHGIRPKWSWDALQPFLHTSNLAGPFPDEEAKLIAGKFAMVTIEKWQGSAQPPYMVWSSTEIGNLARAIAPFAGKKWCK